MKTGKAAAIEALDELAGDSYSVKQAYKGVGKVRGGQRAIGRGLAIAATLAAIDGPLPFGDVAAAGFLIVGGSYMVYSGAKDVIQ